MRGVFCEFRYGRNLGNIGWPKRICAAAPAGAAPKQGERRRRRDAAAGAREDRAAPRQPARHGAAVRPLDHVAVAPGAPEQSASTSPRPGQILDQLEVPPRFFYEEILDQTAPYDPVWLLEHFRGRHGLPRDPFLVAVHDRLPATSRSPGNSGRRAAPKEIEELEEKHGTCRPSTRTRTRAARILPSTSVERAETSVALQLGLDCRTAPISF